MIDGVSNAAFYQFCKRQRIGFAVLFGSAAQGTASAQSDLDLGIWVVGKPSAARALALTSAAMRSFHWNHVDVVLLNDANPLLQWQVASTGRLLYERTAGAFHRFQLLAMKRHHDARRIYRWTREYLDRVMS